MDVMRMRAVRRMLIVAATAALCVAVMGVAAAHDRAPSVDDAQAAPRAVVSSPVGELAAGGLREEAGMLVAGMALIGAAAAVRRAA
jgi:hypothetical protein